MRNINVNIVWQNKIDSQTECQLTFKDTSNVYIKIEVI